MKYKLMCSDLDGTLLNSKNEISAGNEAAIKDYVARGGIFIIITGRMVKSLDYFTKQLGTDSQDISACGFQGGLAFNKNGKMIIHEVLDYRVAATLLKFAEDRGFYTHTYETDSVLISKEDAINRMYSELCRIPTRVVGKLSDYVLKSHNGCYKVMMLVPEGTIHRYMDEIRALALPGIDIVSSSETYLEIIPSCGGKEKALRTVAEYYGIDMSEVISVGDQRNDIGMIKAAGLGCAIGNAIDEVKKEADYITADHNSDGVKQIIERFTEE